MGCSGVYPIVDAQAINCAIVSSEIETKSGSNNSKSHLRALSTRQNVQHDKRSCNSRHCKKQSELRCQTEGGGAPGRERGEGAVEESKRTVSGSVAKMLRSCGAGGRRIGPVVRCQTSRVQGIEREIQFLQSNKFLRCEAKAAMPGSLVGREGTWYVGHDAYAVRVARGGKGRIIGRWRKRRGGGFGLSMCRGRERRGGGYRGRRWKTRQSV